MINPINNRKEIFIPRGATFVFLLIFFFLAYIISPYWTNLPSYSLKAIYLLLFIFIGIAWAFFSSSFVKVSVSSKQIVAFILVFVVVAILNCKTLTSVIPWRGDEDFHITLTLSVVRETPNSWFILGVILIIMIFSLAWKKSLWVIPVGILSLLVILLFVKHTKPLSTWN